MKNLNKKKNKYKIFISKFYNDNLIILNNKNNKIIKPNKFLDYKNLKSFKIIRKINNITYKLKLSKFIKNIFLIFYF